MPAPLHATGCDARLADGLWGGLPSWDNLLEMLMVAQQHPSCDMIILKDQHPIATPASGPAGAYLDGCSIVMNHAEVSWYSSRSYGT